MIEPHLSTLTAALCRSAASELNASSHGGRPARSSSSFSPPSDRTRRVVCGSRAKNAIAPSPGHSLPSCLRCAVRDDAYGLAVVGIPDRGLAAAGRHAQRVAGASGEPERSLLAAPTDRRVLGEAAAVSRSNDPERMFESSSTPSATRSSTLHHAGLRRATGRAQTEWL